MHQMTRIRRLWLALAIASAGIAASSFVLTASLSLHPCHLCIFQRLLFMLIAVSALVSAWRPNVAGGGLVALFSGAGLATATYQTWLQAQPPGSVACSSGQPGLIERFADAFASFGVASQLARSDELVKRYRIDAVPRLTVDGRYNVVAQRAQGFEDMLALTGRIVDLARTTRRG